MDCDTDLLFLDWSCFKVTVILGGLRLWLAEQTADIAVISPSLLPKVVLRACVFVPVLQGQLRATV